MITIHPSHFLSSQVSIKLFLAYYIDTIHNKDQVTILTFVSAENSTFLLSSRAKIIKIESGLEESTHHTAMSQYH